MLNVELGGQWIGVFKFFVGETTVTNRDTPRDVSTMFGCAIYGGLNSGTKITNLPNLPNHTPPRASSAELSASPPPPWLSLKYAFHNLCTSSQLDRLTYSMATMIH